MRGPASTMQGHRKGKQLRLIEARWGKGFLELRGGRGRQRDADDADDMSDEDRHDKSGRKKNDDDDHQVPEWLETMVVNAKKT